MEIIPFSAVGLLVFGDCRDTARDKLSAPYRVIEKGGVLVDDFDGLGLHLHYDDNNRLEFVEAWGPAELTFCGTRFLGRDVSSVCEDMQSLGLEIVDDGNGIEFPGAGIALYSPGGIVAAIAGHRRGYYD
jgi:hypothetical protein